jgi:hypothetical protein
LLGRGRAPQNSQYLAGGEVIAERLARGRVELAQLRAQPAELALARPDQRLMCPAQDLDGLGQVTVGGDRAVLVTVGTHQIGQHQRVARIALGPSRGVPVAVPAHAHRVDRIDVIAGLDQRRDPHAAVGLDPDHHLARLASVLGQQRVQLGDPSHAFSQAPMP